METKNRNLIKYIEIELCNRISRTEFNIAVYSSAISVLESKVGAQPTKRELNKVVADLKQKLGVDVVGFAHDSMGKDWIIYISGYNYQERPECKLYSVNAWSTGLFTAEKLQDFKTQLGYLENSLKHYNAQLLNLSDMVDLMDNHDQQRAELDARLHREVEVFEAQCKVSFDGYDYLIKQAEEMKKEEEREAYYRKQGKEFESRNN